ncbi:hypothetical protein [Oceaniovalibus sp. ACAM 378]|uniref:hypothetical protein n=1 Tax=Oceaniovalibus sp. ACAM 378 TaxID=2599923 RepID=UPI0011D3A6C0|nr:hypothetical protein [Oceaniovalibus sp. ACAM 378]TYB87169.1 hypothetical protein FQ320_15175 [Oceaniovalibus sp. ACAM 378]
MPCSSSRGDPTRAICSSLIVRAPPPVRFPILPDTLAIKARNGSKFARLEILHICHHSLFAPRDFDLSPYFQIVTPHLAKGFGRNVLEWSEPAPYPERVSLSAA